MASVRIPAAFRRFTQDRPEVRSAGRTVGEVLANLEPQWPELWAQLFDGQGAVRRYVNFFHNEVDVRARQGLSTPVADGDRLAIVPAIAGG